jgi:hypothetical protein
MSEALQEDFWTVVLTESGILDFVTVDGDRLFVVPFSRIKPLKTGSHDIVKNNMK